MVDGWNVVFQLVQSRLITRSYTIKKFNPSHIYKQILSEHSMIGSYLSSQMHISNRCVLRRNLLTPISNHGWRVYIRKINRFLSSLNYLIAVLSSENNFNFYFSEISLDNNGTISFPYLIGSIKRKYIVITIK